MLHIGDSGTNSKPVLFSDKPDAWGDSEAKEIFT